MLRFGCAPPFFVGKRMHPSEAVSKNVLFFFLKGYMYDMVINICFWGGHHVTYDIHGLKVPVFFKQLLEVQDCNQPFTTPAVEVQWEMEVQTGHLKSPQGPDLDLYFWRSTPHKTRPKLQTKEGSFGFPKLNMEPQSEGLEDDFPFPSSVFQVPC